MLTDRLMVLPEIVLSGVSRIMDNVNFARGANFWHLTWYKLVGSHKRIDEHD